MDFLTFKQFISIEALIVFYYLGALTAPFWLYFLLPRLIHKYDLVHTVYQQGKESLWKMVPREERLKLLALSLFAFLLLELFWRMLFEFLIGYMQMHDALVALQG